MKRLFGVFVLLLVFAGPARADTFDMRDLKKTWIFNGSGAGFDAAGAQASCNFVFTVRIGDGGAVNGKAGFIDIAGRPTLPVEIIGGRAELGNMAKKYAIWKWTLDVLLPDGRIVTFKSKTRFQFAYGEWNAAGHALGPFTHGTGRWEATNGMAGLVAVQMSRPFQEDP